MRTGAGALDAAGDATPARRRERVARHARFVLGCLALALTPLPARAQSDPPPRPVELSLEQALERARAASEEIRLARSAVDVADAQVRAVKATAFPQLGGTVAYTRTFESPFEAVFEDLAGDIPFGQSNTWTAQLTVSQVLFSAGRVGAAIDIAGSFLESSRLGLVEQVAQLELDVKNAYVRALLATELEKIAVAALEQAESFLAQEELRHTAGRASELDVLRARVSRDNLRPQLVEAANAAQIATLNLKRLIELPLDTRLELTTPLEAPPPEQLAEPRVDAELLRANRAALGAARAAVEIRTEQVQIARAAFLPSSALSIGYGRQIYPRDAFALGGSWSTDFSATIALDIPIFAGGQRFAELRQARLQLEQARLQLGQLEEAVELEYEQALGEKQRAAEAIAARQTTVEAAARVHDLTVLRYERGMATQLDVSQARLELLQARTNLAQAIADFHIAEAGAVRSLAGASGARAAGPAQPSRPVDQSQPGPAGAPTGGRP